MGNLEAFAKYSYLIKYRIIPKIVQKDNIEYKEYPLCENTY
jgi:hypothetical protein